ncbi:MAG: hypothetical protein QNK29_15420 [Desulfobacterales bacterium]|nr:hypothetical protein [Desulfobacterales bacterium]MDX2513370.1 hypothetical protein [Desulfobacterales bacterium]
MEQDPRDKDRVQEWIAEAVRREKGAVAMTRAEVKNLAKVEVLDPFKTEVVA